MSTIEIFFAGISVFFAFGGTLGGLFVGINKMMDNKNDTLKELITTKIDGLHSDFSQRINGLSDKIDSNSGEIRKVERHIGNMEDSFGNNIEDLDNSNVIETHRVDQIEKDLELHKKICAGDFKGKIEDLSKRMTNLDGGLNYQDGDIYKIKKEVGRISVSVKTLTELTTKIGSNVNKLWSKIDDLSHGIIKEEKLSEAEEIKTVHAKLDDLLERFDKK